MISLKQAIFLRKVSSVAGSRLAMSRVLLVLEEGNSFGGLVYFNFFGLFLHLPVASQQLLQRAGGLSLAQWGRVVLWPVEAIWKKMGSPLLPAGSFS